MEPRNCTENNYLNENRLHAPNLRSNLFGVNSAVRYIWQHISVPFSQTTYNLKFSILSYLEIIRPGSKLVHQVIKF